MTHNASGQSRLSFWSMPWWELFAFARGAVVAVLTIVDLCFMRDISLTWGWGLTLGLLLLLAVVANALLGAAEVCWSIVRALISGATRTDARSPVQRHISAAVVRALCAALPVLAFCGGHWAKIPDISFILRNRARLEAAVRDGAAREHDFVDVTRCGERTAIWVGRLDIDNQYWIVHDAANSRTTALATQLDDCLPCSTSRLEHVFGPWYSLVP